MARIANTEMKLWSAVVKDRQTKQTVLITRQEYTTKSKFIEDLGFNGYIVNPNKVKRHEVYEYIMNHTNCEPWDWKNWDMDKDGNIICKE